ncbi:hypothetical protein HZA87_04930 [Candidatus Uhrbacteria bacterium]|nr:hypothetical protein [Candidatus Uhrbacteria bacterium]
MTMTRPRLALLCAALGLLFAFQASASVEDVSFPIAELGNCASQDECFAYCDVAENYDACISYAQANDLLPEEDIQKYKDMQASVENGGPGGCTDETSCESYCSDVEHLEECLTFASENGLMSEDELAEAQKVLTALQSGVSLPGGCTSEEACDAYCQELENMQECMDFATAAGLMSEQEAADAQKVLTIIQSGESPGGCVTKNECDAYCSDPTHMEECIDFAVETGFMTAEEAEKIKEEGSLGLKKDDGEDLDNEKDEFESQDSFTGPGGCTSEEECMSYCSDPTHMEECAAFGGRDDIDVQEFDENNFEDDQTREFDQEDRVLGQDDVPKDEWTPPSDFENQNQIDEGFDYREPQNESERYEYEGDDYQENDIQYNDEGPGGFEEFNTEDIPLDLGGSGDGDEPGTINVNPDSGNSGPSGNEFNGGEQGGGADAGLMKSVKQFFSRAVALLML